jgi:Kef-type K+ transport system membrane component KefB
MEHMTVAQLLATLVIMLAVAKVGGYLAGRFGQPAVLGELLGGVIVGRSILGLVDAGNETVHLLSELGVVILLFAIGLETDLARLFQVGATSLAVAIVGVVLPFSLGFLACRVLGLTNIVAIMAGATLTATSVGITARVLSDLGRLHDIEGQIILGAAVIDDILGLMVLSVVTELAEGREVTFRGILLTSALAIGFLVAVIVVGKIVAPRIFRFAGSLDLPGAATTLALISAFGLAWLADVSGSALIIGAFAAGVIVQTAEEAREIEHGITAIGHFFVPLFFVAVGASVDCGALNPLESASRFALFVGGILIVVGVVGKLLAGYAPFWFRGNKTVVGVGMVPRGEVGLIFAQMGLASGVFDSGLFGGVTLMVMVTTLVAPPTLKFLLGPSNFPETPSPHERMEDLINIA